MDIQKLVQKTRELCQERDNLINRNAEIYRIVNELEKELKELDKDYALLCKHNQDLLNNNKELLGKISKLEAYLRTKEKIVGKLFFDDKKKEFYHA